MKLLDQYSQRTVPGCLEVSGLVLGNKSVTVNGSSPWRKGEFFRKELTVANGSAPVWQSISVAAPGETTVSGKVFVPKTPEAFNYDFDGNLTSDGRWTYTWDAENRLVKLAAGTGVGPQIALQFDYDHQGRRIRQRVWNNPTWSGNPTNDVRYVYDGWNLLASLNPASSVRQAYLWGLDLSGTMQGAGGVGGLLAITDASQGSHFCAYDGNGNVAALVKADGSGLTAQYEYGPFGELLRTTGPMAKANPFRFSTKYQDDETDLLYYGYRYYNPSTGRWPNRDPIGEQGGQNLYCGLRNDPNNYIDPLGLKQCVGAGVQSFGFGGQGNIGPIGYLIAGRGSFAYQRCSTCCGKQDDIVDINASFQASFTGSSGFAQVVLGVDWGAMVRYGILVRGGVEATAGARFESDRCNGKGLTGKMCLSGKGSLGIGGGAVATVTVAGLVQQFGADLMGNGYATITRCYECNNDHCESDLLTQPSCFA
ncbi:MAG TPA: RHS repeat-associated core domain-containing protein [Verrucomicrobiota bacterium]|nr:RHS repeat-associated core domain-containing protein [Verrucomicrobiota bacterium]